MTAKLDATKKKFKKEREKDLQKLKDIQIKNEDKIRKLSEDMHLTVNVHFAIK